MPPTPRTFRFWPPFFMPSSQLFSFSLALNAAFFLNPFLNPLDAIFANPIERTGPRPRLDFVPWRLLGPLHRKLSKIIRKWPSLIWCIAIAWFIWFLSVETPFLISWKLKTFLLMVSAGFLCKRFSVLTENECPNGWFYCEVWFSHTLSGETPVFFRGLLARGLKNRFGKDFGTDLSIDMG